jgi:hypothetical protein
MVRRQLLVLAVFLAVWMSGWLSYRLLYPVAEDANEEPGFVEPVTKSEPINPYPNAVSVNLLVHDIEPDRGAGGRSSKPQGTLLTDAQRAEFDLSVRKITLLNDGNVGAVACFDPHHFFRYHDATGNKVGEIAVCFCCANTRFDPVIETRSDKQWIDVDIGMAERFIKKLGLPTNMHCPDIE